MAHDASPLPPATIAGTLRPPATPQDRLTALEAHARTLFAAQYVGSFDSPEWRISSAPGRRGKQSGEVLRFGRIAGRGTQTDSQRGLANDAPRPVRRRETEAWSALFAQPFKILVATTDNSHSWGSSLLACGHLLHQALATEHGATLATFAWPMLTAADCDRVLVLLKTVRHGQGIHREASRFSQLLSWLQKELIVRAFDWSHDVPDPRDANRNTLAGRFARKDRLPLREAVTGLATVYNKAALSWADQLLTRATGLLLLTGLRVEELVTLAADCLFPAERFGRVVYGIRYRNEKAGGTDRERAVRWLSPLSGRLAKQLIQEILILTAEQRSRAIDLERDPTRVPLPEPYASREDIQCTELAGLLNYSTTWVNVRGRYGYRMVLPYRFTKDSAPNSQPRTFYIRVADAERALVSERPSLTVETPHAGIMPLSRALFLAWAEGIKYESPLSSEPRGRTFFPTVLRADQVQSFLSGSGNWPSVFARHEITYAISAGERGTCYMSPHQCRHWLNTLANQAGMTAFQITRWMQRGSADQTEDYLHDLLYDCTTADSADLAMEEVLDGRAWGRRADEVRRLPREEQSEHLQATLTTAYPVETGWCTANFDQGDACDFDRACTERCPFHLYRHLEPGPRRAALVQLESARRAERRFAQVVAEGGRVAESQHVFVARHVSGLEEMLRGTPCVASSAIPRSRQRAAEPRPPEEQADAAPD
jgi:hypothetical protein